MSTPFVPSVPVPRSHEVEKHSTSKSAGKSRRKNNLFRLFLRGAPQDTTMSVEQQPLAADTAQQHQTTSIVQWLETDCPQDVVPKILAFCGPQKTAALGRTNRHWRNVMQQEGTWRVLCEELYKVRETFVFVREYACAWCSPALCPLF